MQFVNAVFRSHLDHLSFCCGERYGRPLPLELPYDIDDATEHTHPLASGQAPILKLRLVGESPPGSAGRDAHSG